PWPLAFVTASLVGSSVTLGDTPRPPPPGPPAENGGALPPVAAPSSIYSEVMVIHGTNEGTGIDPKLGRMPALSKPPFSAYNSYKLLSHTTLTLVRGQPSLLNLPTGRQLQLLYKDVALKEGANPRYLVSASIQSPNGKSFLPLVEVKAQPHEWFWVG